MPWCRDGSDSLACAVQNLVNHRIIDEKETDKIDTKELENDLMHSFSKDYNGYAYKQQYSNNYNNNYNNNVKKVDLNKIMSNIQQQNNNTQQQNNNYIEDQNFVYYQQQQQQQQENNTETEDSVDMEYFRYD